MKRRAATGFVLLLGASSTGLARPALAVEQSCATLSVEADSDLRARHPELAPHVHRAFDGRSDVESCPRITLSLERSRIGVQVELPDGRSARRSLERSEDVVPTLEALLLVPEISTAGFEPARPIPPAPAKPKRRTASRPEPVSEIPELDRGVASSSSKTFQPSLVRINLSGAVGARVGDGFVGATLGLSSFLEVSTWLVGLQARADQYKGASDSVGVLELAVPIGKRVYLEPFALDLVAGPAFAWQGASMQSDVAAQAPEQDAPSDGVVREHIVSESGVEPRAFVGARLSFDALSSFHGFVAFDGDFALAENNDGPTGVPELPAWTLGLSVGSTVGTR
jgi:hypothetical protein